MRSCCYHGHPRALARGRRLRDASKPGSCFTPPQPPLSLHSKCRDPLNWPDAVLGLGREWKVARAEPVEVSSLRRGVPGLRYGPPRVAEPGRLGLQDRCGLQCFAGPVPGARGGRVSGDVGGGSLRYTARVEAELIAWLKEASVKTVGDRTRLGWNAMVDGVMQRAVALGLARRKTEAVRRLSVDKVRRAEDRALVKKGNGILVGTRWQWLKGSVRKTHAEMPASARLRPGTRRTAQPWELKEAATLSGYRSKLGRWPDGTGGWSGRRAAVWAPVPKTARMIREHLWCIVRAPRIIVDSQRPRHV